MAKINKFKVIAVHQELITNIWGIKVVQIALVDNMMRIHIRPL